MVEKRTAIYTEEMLESMKKVEAARAANTEFEPRRMTAEEKEKLFAEWGYSAEDAHWLQSEMERQAREKYVSGNYQLGNLNLFGQRINIRIEIPRKDGWGTVSFISGWMVKPNGKLELTTPYGGK